MIRAIIYIGILFLAISCGQRQFRPQTGDLLFQAGDASAMGEAIEAATGGREQINFIHVAIAIRSQGADSVLEATSQGGVCLRSLTDFLDGSARINNRPAVAVYRLRDTNGLAAAILRARGFLGQPYDFSFRPNNGRIYCSELVWESYRTPGGEALFSAHPMNFRAADGQMPAYWTDLFDQLGEPIPQGVPGTNPNDLAQEPRLRHLFDYYR